MPENITFEQVKRWVLDNSDNQEAMDTLNKMTWMFTTKYKHNVTRG